MTPLFTSAAAPPVRGRKGEARPKTAGGGRRPWPVWRPLFTRGDVRIVLPRAPAASLLQPLLRSHNSQHKLLEEHKLHGTMAQLMRAPPRALQTLDTATRSTAVALSVERLFCPPALRTFRPPATKVASSWQTTHLYRCAFGSLLKEGRAERFACTCAAAADSPVYSFFRWTPQRAAHSRIPLISVSAPCVRAGVCSRLCVYAARVCVCMCENVTMPACTRN